MEEPLIGIREAARNVGISHSTLSRQVARRQVRSHGGKVRLSEVYEDRANNIDRTIWMHRKKKSTPKIGSGQDAPSLNGAAVHSADDGAYAPDEFTPEMVIEYGRMLDVNDDRRSDPKIVGSVMALTGVEMIIAELCKLGWRRDDPRPAADDDDLIGPRPCFTFDGQPLDMGLVRKLGRAIMTTDPSEPTDPNDPVAVGEALLLTAIDILDEEVKRRRVEAATPNFDPLATSR